MQFKWLAPVIVGLGLAAATPAAALPVTPLSGYAVDPQLIQVQNRGDRRMDRGPRRAGPQRAAPRRDFRRPPPGWQRYNARPRDWQRRRCSQIGPVWFCP